MDYIYLFLKLRKEVKERSGGDGGSKTGFDDVKDEEKMKEEGDDGRFEKNEEENIKKGFGVKRMMDFRLGGLKDMQQEGGEQG